MPDGSALICAVSGCSPDRGKDILTEAAALGVDPLVLVRTRCRIDDEEIFARAARWAGLAFSPVVPDSGRFRTRRVRVENLAEVRSLRVTLFDRDVLFVAPTLGQFLALAEHVGIHDETRRRLCIVPPAALRRALVWRHRDILIDFSRQNLARAWPFSTAHLDLGLGLRLGFVLVLVLLLAAAVLAPFEARPVLVPLFFVVLVLPSWFRIAAIVDEPAVGDTGPERLSRDAELPVYSVLVPLRDEAHMVPQLVRALLDLDYPQEKLDVKFIVEEESPATVAAVQHHIKATGYELVTVPPAPPRTKPKALNFALPLARGRFVTVYDAEDMPAPDQLRRAASLFAQQPAVACIQAELVPDNADENAVTALFASEYGGQFGIMLPCLVNWGFPVPLGGTSNHFRLDVLRRIGGWDAFNVTEDADLGLRLARRGIRTVMLNSPTYEEAPVTLPAWFRQRTRWMKGWMQTFLVHNRRPLALLKDLGPVNFLAFQIYVGGMILTPPLHTLYMLAVAIRLVFAGLTAPGADPLSLVEMFTLAIGYLSAIGLSVFGLIRLGRPYLIRYQLLLPFYWALMGLASFRAGFELIRNPHFWSKTSHGISRMRRGSVTTDARSAARSAAEKGWSG